MSTRTPRVCSVLALGFFLQAFSLLSTAQPASSAPPSTEIVGALGLPERIHFIGNNAFSAAALRKGLAAGAQYLTASHSAAPRAPYFALLESALVRGYRYAGFPQAAINVAAEIDRVVVTITEGPRLMSGDIIVHGAREVPESDLRHALISTTSPVKDASLATAVETVLQFFRAPKQKKAAEEQLKKTTGIALPSSVPPGLPASAQDMVAANQAFLANSVEGRTEALWTHGKPARLDPGFIDEVTGAVRALLSERSHPLAEVAAVIEPDVAARAHLTLRINEGPRARIGTIEVGGNIRNSTEEIIQTTGLKPGTDANVAAVTAAKVALWNSARFYAFDVVARPRGSQSREVDIVIEVEENESMPLVRDPLPRDQAAVVRLANWITTEGARREVSLALSSKGKARFALALSPLHGLAVDAVRNDGVRLALVYGSNGHRVLASHGGRTASREFSASSSVAQASVWLLTQADPEKTGRHSMIQMGASMKTRGTSNAPLLETNLIVSPALACKEILGDKTLQFEGDTATLSGTVGGSSLRWREDTGELISWTVNHDDGTTIELRSGGAEFERIDANVKATIAALPPAARTEPILAQLFSSPLLGSFDGLKTVQDNPWFSRVAVAGNFIEAALGVPAIAEMFSGNKEEAKGFFVPPVPGEQVNPSMIASLFGSLYYDLAVMLWPTNTWPSKLGRELFYTLTGNTGYTAAVMDELLRDPAMGPIGCIVAGRLLRATHPALAWQFARRALDRGTAENFRQDWRLLLNNEMKAGEIAQQLVRVLGRMSESEVTTLLGGLPETAAEPIRKVHTVLRENVNQPLETLLEPVLDSWWNTEIRPNLESRIGAIMAGDQAVDPVIEGFTVNGLPISRKIVNLASREPQRFAFVPPPTGTAKSSANIRARDMLVRLTLLDLDLRSRGQAVADAFLDQRIASEIRVEHGGDPRKLASALTKAGLTAGDFREIMRLRCIAEAAREGISAKVGSPTPAEIRRALAEPLPPLAERRTIRAIGFSPGPNAAERAKKLRGELSADTTFDQTWRRYTTQAPPGARAFELMKALRTDAQPAVADSAFALEPGAVSAVVESGGWHYLVSVAAVHKGDSPEEKQARAVETARERKRDAAMRTHLTQLRRAAIVQTLQNPALRADNSVLPMQGIRIELESLTPVKSANSRVFSQPMDRWGGGKRWSGGKQAHCTSAPEGWVEWEFVAPADGDYALDVFATRAGNFCQVQPSLDGKNVGAVLEFYGPVVNPTGAVRLGSVHLKAGTHTFRCTVVGQHRSSTSYQFGIDALDLIPVANAEK